MKKPVLILIFLCFATLHLSAKVVRYVDTAKIYSVKLANTDLKNGKIKFLIRGGIVASYIKGQELFEKKYGVDYYDFGCVMPSGFSIEDYNKAVASFMDRKYGKVWRKEVRKDIQGI